MRQAYRFNFGVSHSCLIISTRSCSWVFPPGAWIVSLGGNPDQALRDARPSHLSALFQFCMLWRCPHVRHLCLLSYVVRSTLHCYAWLNRGWATRDYHPSHKALPDLACFGLPSCFMYFQLFVPCRACILHRTFLCV